MPLLFSQHKYTGVHVLSHWVLRLGMDLLAMLVLLFALYQPRYGNRAVCITAALFNVFTFAVLSVLASVEFSIAAGFGLFAILALFSLRSEPIDTSDLSYFFGSIALAVITSIQGTSLLWVCILLVVVLLAVYLIDHARLLPRSARMRVLLDRIEPDLFAPGQLQQTLSERLGVQVLDVRILRVCYVTEVLEAQVTYRC